MRLHDIFEDDDNGLDQADNWLSKYTYENLDKWPSKEILRILIKRYPAQAGTVVYRGMNFDTREDWDEFQSKIKNNQVDFHSISSWSPDPDEAKQFALTKPTYFLSQKLAQANDEMNQQKERMIGYRGIIIATQVPEGKGIDVNATDFAKESEVILAPGTYKIKVHSEVKRFGDMVADQDENLASILEKYLDVRNRKETNRYYEKFYKYMMHHYGDEVAKSEELKEKVYQISMAYYRDHQSLEELIDVNVKKPFKFEKDEPTEIQISFSQAIFYLKEQGWLPKKREGMLTKYAELIVSCYEQTLKKYSGIGYTYHFGPLEILEKYVKDTSRIQRIMQQQIGDVYHSVNSRDRVKDINKIKDPQEKRQEIERMKKELLQTLGQMN